MSDTTFGLVALGLMALGALLFFLGRNNRDVNSPKAAFVAEVFISAGVFVCLAGVGLAIYAIALS